MANPGVQHAPTIQIQEPVGRTTSREDMQSPHGIYSMRLHSANSFPPERSFTFTRSFSRSSSSRRRKTNADWDAESGIQQEGDFKEKQVRRAPADMRLRKLICYLGVSWQDTVLV